MVIYAGETPSAVTGLLDASGSGAWTGFSGAHGSGQTGRREGTRAWPGEEQVFLSLVPDEAVAELRESLAAARDALPPGERMHAAVMPVEDFF
jgi:hypothetical protein